MIIKQIEVLRQNIPCWLERRAKEQDKVFSTSTQLELYSDHQGNGGGGE